MTKRTKPAYVPQALKVYWEEKKYGPTLSKILCPSHRDFIFRLHPCARGYGEFFPVEQCERCAELGQAE